jgi:hypothetical protein
MTTNKPQVRFATYNTSLNRDRAGALLAELRSGVSRQAAAIAAVLQTMRADVLVLNELDYEPGGAAVQALQDNFLAVPQAPGLQPLRCVCPRVCARPRCQARRATAWPAAEQGADSATQPRARGCVTCGASRWCCCWRPRWRTKRAPRYPHVFTAPVNTGVPSGRDFDHDGRTDGPADAYGYGFHPGASGGQPSFSCLAARSRARQPRAASGKHDDCACLRCAHPPMHRCLRPHSQASTAWRC